MTDETARDLPSAKSYVSAAFPLSAAALHEWAAIVEHVQRGMAHSLNNRAAALIALRELLSDRDEQWSGAATILAAELGRVQELVQVSRALGASGAEAEAFLAADAARDAARVLALHTELRERAIEIEAQDAPPARLPRSMFIRALICVAVDAAARTPARAPCRLSVAGDDSGDWIVARVSDRPGPSASRCAGELAAAMGGELLRGELCGFRVPSLATIRRRERR